MEFFRRLVTARLFVICLMACAFVFCAAQMMMAEVSSDKEIAGIIERANQGDAIAQSNLGLMYENGEGVPQNYKQAVFWFTKAAEQGHEMAQCHLGLLYKKGQGVSQRLWKNYIYAYAWLALCASKGGEEAITNRDKVAASLSPQQLSKAQKLALKFQKKIDEKAMEPAAESQETIDEKAPEPAAESQETIDEKAPEPAAESQETIDEKE